MKDDASFDPLLQTINMKSLGILAFSALVALASAIPQTATSTTATLSPQASCAINCARDDICCQAKCVGVPCPDQGMANKTTECAAACPQGNGSPADTAAYGQCQFSCISSYFFTPAGAATLPTGAATSAASTTHGSATGGSTTGAASKSGGSSGSGSQTASATSSGASAKSSGGAASPHHQLGSSAAGIIGLVMAALAL